MLNNFQLSVKELGVNHYSPIEETTHLETTLQCRDEISGEYVLKITNNAPHEWQGIIHVEYQQPYSEDARVFMPAFMYGRNRGDWTSFSKRLLYPRLREGETTIPYASYWMVRSDRLSHPVSMIYINNWVYGISVEPKAEKQYNGFSCSISDGCSIGFTLGYENAPVLFIESEFVEKQKIDTQNCFLIEPYQTKVVSFFFYRMEASDETRINTIIKEVYHRFHEAPKNDGTDIETCVKDLAEAVLMDSYIKDNKNYSTQVFIDDNKQVTFNPFASISWTGGVEVATPMLMAGIRLRNEEMRKQALECIQNIVDHSMNPLSGLPFDAYDKGVWTIKGWWDEFLSQSGHSSYLIGQALFYILKAYDYERKEMKIVHTEWLSFAVSVLDQIETTINSEGEFPYLWDESTGKGVEYDAFSGCWCLASLAYLAILLNDKSRIERCRKSEAHYFHKFVKHMECYGTPHDTWKAVDSEGILSYIKLVKILHIETKEDVYLHHLKTALEYEFSFIFCYNTKLDVPPLNKINWSSCGGSVTSTCNPHIHPMANIILDELHYYCEKTGDDYFKMRMKDMIVWGLQSYNRYDNEFDYGKKGWMSERFCYSEAYLTETYPNGNPSSSWFVYLPWSSTTIIEGYCGDLWGNYVINREVTSC